MTRRIFLGSLLTGAALAAVTSAAPPAPPAPKAAPLTLEKVAVTDSWVNNMEACTLLKPAGWKFDGGMKWYPNFIHQVCFEARVTDPNSLQQYEALPWCGFVSITKPVFPLTRMSNYMGNVVLEPTAPAEMNEKLVVPTVRKGVRAKVLSHNEMPEVAKMFGGKLAPEVKAVRTRIEYVQDGKAVEEDFYLILGYTTVPFGQGTLTLWNPVVPPFALRAAKGQLDEATPRLLTIAHSARTNLEWAKKVVEVQGMFLARMGLAIQNAGELSKQISRNSEITGGLIKSSYEYRNRVQDRVAKDFSDYIRGVQAYTGGGATYTLPNTYQYAWATSGGAVVMSNDPSYNPNVGSTSTWTPLTPATR